MENRVRALEIEMGKAEARVATTLKALLFGGSALAILWGYTNFVSMPGEVKKALDSKSFKELLDAAERSKQQLLTAETQAKQQVEALRLLVKQYDMSNAVVAFGREECPAGWVPFEGARGRYLVGVQAGGQTGHLVGKGLANGENRSTGDHSHAYSYTGLGGQAKRKEDAIAWGKVGEAERRKVEAVAASAGAVEGTNAPYVQLLFCQPSRN